ncbi:hypothetical protein [Parabacteroides chongii]|uniref:hypothetical protein n=1 Tax=Parabacteroides chongii TaxID=2685834 RepID=UPI00240D54DF|nr:hypothetical protein [Parabacteroides chongii]WFE86978.1 hypothetical protein P3L47_10490 [Parabacteroides chongii]
MKKSIVSLAAMTVLLSACGAGGSRSFKTDRFGIDIDNRGYITGMWDLTKENRNFSPADQPSPLLALYDEELRRYYYPQKASYSGGEYRLEYENGSVATVSLEEKSNYFKLKLESLEPRNGIDDVQWGNYYTNIDNILGEIIGVARDTSATVCYAIGALALDDNTIGGESRFTSETGPGGYIAHSPDHVNHPLPLELHEGQQFTMGGDGYNDVAFYDRKESYYRNLGGTSAFVDCNGRIHIHYHSRDRRKGKMIYSPEGNPIFHNNEPNHMMRQDVPGVDFIGSSIALWGSPDSTALMEVIQNIVLSEGLPYPTFQGKWVKDPTAFLPDLRTYGGVQDSMASYAKQMGLKVIHTYDQPFLHADRGNGGFIDGSNHENKRYHFTDGDISTREYADLLAKDGLILGRTSISNSMAPGTKDCSPVPSDSICILHRRFLTADLNETDTLIYIDDPTHLEEVACWEGHIKELNMVKIGKELIHYLGVSTEKPYRLLNVTRGYWNTVAVSHAKGDAVDKLQPTVGWGYQGLIPNLALQDEISIHYADICKNSGLGMFDYDGQEFFYHTGFGNYGVKRFFRNMFAKAKEYGLPDIRFTGAGLSEGSWHYQSIWNVGGGLNIYDVKKRVWGSTTSQGKDLRDMTYANYFPSSFGANFPITATSTVEDYEHIEATAVGYGATYNMTLGQKDVESCPQKYAIFNVIRTWEEARRADAFPTYIKKLLQNPALSWRLEEKADKSGWTLYQMENGKKGCAFDLCAQ